mgnify:FL=1
MKNKILIYLLIFVALIGLYLYVSGGKISAVKDERIASLQDKVQQLKDSVQKSEMSALEMQYFSLENNDDALAYYDHLEIEDPTRYISDKLLETNEQKGDNPLIPYAGMESDFKINRIKLLNHKWIVADFSDGKYWGEVLLKYELKDDMGVDFTLIDHLLYTRGN